LSLGNLSNNSQIELIHNQVKNTNNECKIALSIEGKDTINGNFSSSKTLYEVLQSFINESKLPSDLFTMLPEIIYLRSNFSGEEILNSTTLSSIGLSK
jgi:hypothetical protein